MQIPGSPVLRKDIGDGIERRLLLLSDELRQIRRECGRGFYTLYSNFSQDAEPDEVATIIRLALIGGGMPPQEAGELVDYYCRAPRPLKPVYILAYEILNACWAGVEEKQASGNPADQEIDIDDWVETIEARLVAAGADASVVKGKTLAELQKLMALSRKNAKADDGASAPAPDRETFEAIKRASKGMK